MSTWNTWDGRSIPLHQLSSNHLWNIIKYKFTENQHNLGSVLHEASKRGMLTAIGHYIPAQPGYLEPIEVRRAVAKKEIAHKLALLNAQLEAL